MTQTSPEPLSVQNLDQNEESKGCGKQDKATVCRFNNGN